VVNAGDGQTVNLTQSVPWSPALLTPQLWLDADDNNTITLNGTTVSQWSDKSGFNHHATQPEVSSQPAATAAGLNGKRVITFDGTADALNVDLDFLANVSHSAFIVTKPTAFNNIYGAANGGSGANSLHVGFNGNDYRMNFWLNDYGPARTANFFSGSANIMNYIWTTGISKQIMANGKSEGISTSPVPGTIGAMSGGGRIGSVVGQGFYGGDIAEFIVVTDAVSATDREKMEGYLAHKWGLAGNLAAAHPHKGAAPLGSATATATLDGTATDTDPLTTTWTMVSGPASVSFGNAGAVDTTATFTVAGTYTLRLTANDGYGQVSSDVVITVNSFGSVNSVTYNGNGNTGGTAPANQIKIQDVNLTLSGVGTLIKTGYTFTGWNTVANGSGTSYAAGATYVANAPLSLFAQWTMLPYTSWAAGTFANPFTDTALTSNPDGDGFNNLLEFAFGMDPTSPVTGPLVYNAGGNVVTAGFPILQNFAAVGQPADYRAVFARRKDHIAAGLTYTVQCSADMGLWTTNPTSPSVQTGAGSAGNMEAVSVPFPAAVPLQAGGSAPPTFFRVRVTGN
jgi:uncharacterized repeat protein (TIGR02543 family)